VDCLARGAKVRKHSTLDAIGAGPRLVAGILESEGCEVGVIQCEEAVRRAGALSGYEALFVSGMVTDIPSMVRVLSRWRGGPAVAGGPSFVDYEYLLRSGFDYVVWGEGEISIPRLVDVLKGIDEPTVVPNLAYISRGKVVRNSGPLWAPTPPLWSYMPSVNAVTSYPGWWGARVYVEVVRGCSNYHRPTIPLPNKKPCIGCGKCWGGPLRERLTCPSNIPPGCGYCSVPAIFGPARSRPEDSIVREVEELIKLGVRRVVLSAPDFLDYGRDWLVAPEPLTDPRNPLPNLAAIESLLRKVTSIPEVIEGKAYVMIENVKPNLINEEVAEILGKYLRGTPVHIGLESGHPRHHVALGRPSRVEEVIRAVKLLRKAGLKPYIYVIHGLPGENQQVIKATVKVVRKLWRVGVEKVTLYRFTPIKGTAFEGFPKPPPAVKSVARPLYNLVRRLNYVAKRRLIGKEVKVIGVSYDSVRREVTAYMLPHGPVTRVVGDGVGPDLVGRVFAVVVKKAVSDRVVEAALPRRLN